MAIIVVCGLGRCGSSLTMQMLDAAGIPCNGEGPIFEHEKGNLTNQDPEWLTQQEGKATKVLLPYLYNFKPANYKFIWVDRLAIHQACSSIKLKHILIEAEHDQQTTAKSIIKMAKAYETDRKRSFKHMSNFGDVLSLNFADLIEYPESSAALILGYLNHPSIDLNETVKKMVDVVIPRSIEPFMDMQLEADLINKYKKVSGS